MGSLVNTAQLRIAINQINQLPEEGAKSIPLLLDFTNTATWSVDLTNFQQLGYISMIQTVYIDNSSNGNPLSVIVGSNSGQVITAAPNTQGYYPVLCPNPAQFTISTLQGSGLIPIQLINTPIPGPVWSVL
jgi:hypothetical protein